LHSSARGVATLGQGIGIVLRDPLCCLAALGWRLGLGFGDPLSGLSGHGWNSSEFDLMSA
jgi:hypothetical protein